MALSHYKNSVAAINAFEVVNPSLFEVQVWVPGKTNDNAINDPDASHANILLEHVHSISGLDGLNPSVNQATQKFKFAERHYAGGPESTHLELQMNFSLNLNYSHENYVYTILRSWCNKIYNPMTGSFGLKRDYVGKLVILEYDRDGSVWRKITCEHVFPMGQMTGMGERNYDNTGDANELQITFMCDYWTEEVIGLPTYTTSGGGANINEASNNLTK